MMKDFKIALSMLKYAFNVKLQVVALVIFSLAGIVIEIATKGTFWLSSIFLLIVPMYFAQLLYGLCMSNMIQTSPYKKRFQTTLPALGNLIFSGILMALIIAAKIVEIKMWPENAGVLIDSLIMAAIVVLLFNAYTAIIFKYYYLALVFLLIPIWGMSFYSGFNAGSGTASLTPSFGENISFAGAVILAIASVVLSTLAQYGISLLLYKKPLSKNAQGAMLKKYLK